MEREVNIWIHNLLSTAKHFSVQCPSTPQWVSCSRWNSICFVSNWVNWVVGVGVHTRDEQVAIANWLQLKYNLSNSAHLQVLFNFIIDRCRHRAVDIVNLHITLENGTSRKRVQMSVSVVSHTQQSNTCLKQKVKIAQQTVKLHGSHILTPRSARMDD